MRNRAEREASEVPGFLRMYLLGIAAERLHAFHGLAGVWVVDTEKKLTEPPPGADDEYAEWLQQRNEMVMWAAESATELAGAALAVFITAYVEDSLKMLWRVASRDIPSCAASPLRTRPGWGDICQAWGAAFSTSLESLACSEDVKKTRLIANSFKHNDGFPQPELVELLSVSAGERLKYNDLVGFDQVGAAKVYVGAVYDFLAERGMKDF